MLDNATIALLEERRIEPELLSSLGIETSTTGSDWIEIPFTVAGKRTGTKTRRVDSLLDARFKGKQSLYNFDALSDTSLAQETLILAQDEMSAWALMQAGYRRVVALPAISLSDDPDMQSRMTFLKPAIPLMRDAQCVVLAMDRDETGIAVMNELALVLGKHRCKWLAYPKVDRDSEVRCCGVSDVLLRYGEKGVVQTVNGARWMKIGGLYKLRDIPPQPEHEAIRIGIAGLDAHAWMRQGDFWVITGEPSGGKTALVTEIACHMTRDHGWPVCFASFEQRRNDMRRYLRTYFHGKREWAQSPDEWAQADEWINDRFTFLYSDEDTDKDLAWVLERFAAAVTQEGCKLCILDPWNEIEHQRGTMNTSEYTSWALRKVKRFGEKYQATVLLVAHPSKPPPDRSGKRVIPNLYSIADSAAFYNRPDVGIIVHREGDDTTLWTQKIRYAGIIGHAGKVRVRFDVASGRYFTPPTAGGARPEEDPF